MKQMQATMFEDFVKPLQIDLEEVILLLTLGRRMDSRVVTEEGNVLFGFRMDPYLTMISRGTSHWTYIQLPSTDVNQSFGGSV